MKVRIEVGQLAINSRVWLDDVEITNAVVDLVVGANVGDLSRLVLTLCPKEIEITGEAGEVFTRRFSVLNSEEAAEIATDLETLERRLGRRQV